jgi:hypothetical protein
MKLYEEHGWAIQVRHLGRPLVYGQVETGDVNSYVHIWVYADASDRAIRRAALAGDPDWQNYLKLSAEAGNLISQVNTLLSPLSFFQMPDLD